MRLTKLSIDAFRAIKHADIEFGQNLNILYGPNDLGKSTIAAAIRAALLVPPNSSDAATYASWFSSENARVELTLVDPSGHYWRVRKTFGTSSSSAAELLHSKDSLTFTHDCKARQVEEKLRTMLAWGIPSPGGKGGPRGVPSSFLANVLLASQTDVDEILEQSITDDLDDSGKLRLTKALSTLAQDPLFKDVLRVAQSEVDLFFTVTGMRKRGQSSQFKEAADKVKVLRDELEIRARELEESSAIEEDVNTLREARSLALVRVDEAKQNLAVVQAHFDNTVTRTATGVRLAAERDALADIDAQITELNALTAELEAIGERINDEQDDFTSVGSGCDVAYAAVQAAEEAHRLATSEDAARELELRRAQLAERAADLTAKLLAMAGRKADIGAAIQARDAASLAHSAVTTTKATSEIAVKNRDDARAKVQAGAQELELSRAILAFIRWRDASATIEEASKARDAASAAMNEADQKDAGAATLETEIGQAEERLLIKSANLPTEEQARALLQLERDLEKAEAALGGGISVAVRPSASVAIRAEIDQQPPMQLDLSTNRAFEAERTMRLAIANLVEVDITAGSADKQKAVEELRIRWTVEALPLFTQAGVNTRTEIAGLVDALALEREATADLKRRAEGLRSEAKSLREKANIHEERASAGQLALAELEARKSAIGVADVHSIEEEHRKLNSPSESNAELLHKKSAEEQQNLQSELAAHDQAVAMAEYRLSEAQKLAADLDAVRAAKLSTLESTDLDGLQSKTLEEFLSLEREQSDNASLLHSLASAANSEVQNAQATLLQAQEAHRIAKESLDSVLATLNASRAEHNVRSGALRERRAQIERLDRNAAELLVTTREAELAALPIERPATLDDVQSAKNNLEKADQEHDRAKQDLNVKEGVLSRVGGAALREEVERLEEARIAAETREHELEIDADAWKLLRDTLREVENDEGAHLGRALAHPVTARFEELTGGRYRGLRLDAALRADGLEAVQTSATGDEVLEALSVGTRGQLAALVRLTIADQLKSTIVLDDHLVHTDPTRLLWFRDALQKTAVNAQVIVLTCRAEDYLLHNELPVETATRDLVGGIVRVIDLARVLTRFET